MDDIESGSRSGCTSPALTASSFAITEPSSAIRPSGGTPEPEVSESRPRSPFSPHVVLDMDPEISIVDEGPAPFRVPRMGAGECEGLEPEAQVFGVRLVAKSGQEMDVLLEVDYSGITLRETGGEPLCSFELSALEAWGKTDDGFTFQAVSNGRTTRCNMRTELGGQISEACHVAAARMVEQLREMDSRLVENLEEAVSEVRLDTGGSGGASSSADAAPKMFYVEARPAGAPLAAPQAQARASVGMRSKLGLQWPGRSGASRLARPHQD